jgi:hypothetical protein
LEAEERNAQTPPERRSMKYRAVMDEPDGKPVAVEPGERLLTEIFGKPE